jgi:transposase
MARTGRPKAELIVSGAEREALERWSRRPSSAQALALRSRIVLACAEGQSNQAVARRERVTPQTVGKWRRRFVERRLDGLVDEPRPGQPRKITDERVEEVIVKTLEQAPPDGGTHWSTRQMAAQTGLNQTAISKIWRAFGLQPHRVEDWKLSKDPLFVEKVRDVVGLYLDPPERAIVLCVDEKSQIQALDRTAPTLPMLPCTPARATHDYKRSGTSTLFAALATAPSSSRSSWRRLTPKSPPSSRCTDPRQLRDPQNTGDRALAQSAPAVRVALHADRRLMAKPRRALVRRTDQPQAQARHAPLRP